MKCGTLMRGASEKEWEAHDDAMTLVRAEMIKKDAKRYKAAQKHAAKMSKEEMEEAEIMRKLGNVDEKKSSGKYKKAKDNG